VDNSYIKGDIFMRSDDISSISNYVDLHLQSVRKLYITVEVIDDKNRTIETIQGLSTGGSLSVSGGSLIRRTGSLSFVLFDNLLPKKGNILWMTNKIRVYAGLERMASNEDVTHFCLGTFFITEPSIDITKDTRSISISLEDNMMRWEQKQLETKMVIEAGTPLNTAVISLMNMLGEWNTNVEFTTLKVPYTLEFNEGDSILDILTTLRDLYMDWECYYDLNGDFVFKKMNIQREDGEPVVWRFDDELGSDLITTFSETFTYKGVKNRILVIGQMDEQTGITPKSEAFITNLESPFHEDEIGQKSKVIIDSSLGDTIQCDSKARFELFKASTFQEKASIGTIPIYYLDVNDLIEVKNPATNEVERYVIDSISTGLTIEEEMKLSCHKVYYNQFDIGSELGDYSESAEIIIDGIENKGWLSLSEQRVSEYLGLEGQGSKLTVRFEYDGLYGVTAYVTGYIGEANQTLTIDLADFESSQGDSGNNGNGKAEYSDRVLGHEMVHAIMNDSLGISKTSTMPIWFKEGVAEFIHGADERLKLSIVENGLISDTLLNNLVSRSVELLNGASWQSVSDDYSAGYLIVKYLDTKILAGKDMKNIMLSIKQSTKTGDLAIKDSIVENTEFLTYQDFVSNLSTHLANHVKYNVTLNIGSDEVDTGSIGGSDHRGTVDLNAEAIFDNSLATSGLSATGFNVEFIRP
jgi:hypothetical protein